MKQIIPNYSFNKTNGQITFTDFAAIDLERVLLVVNVTDGVVVYQFNDPSKLASAATNVLDLAYDTSAMDNADKLLIIYDVQSGDPTYEATPALASGAATAANQITIIGHVDGIETVLATIDGHVDGLETLVGTGNSSLSSIDGKITAVNTGAVTIASSVLPTGAATAALQTQPGVDIGDVTVNNAAGAGAVNIQDGGNSITVDGTVTANTGLTQPLTDTQLRASAVPVSVSGVATSTKQSDGSQKTQVVDGSGNVIGATSNALDVNVKSSTTLTVGSHAVTNAGTFAVQADNTKVGGTTIDTNSGNKSAGTQRVVIATDQPSFAIDLAGDSVSSQTNLTTTATVSGSAGKFHGGSFLNLNSAPAYIQVFDTTGAVTLGTTTPTFVQPIPANGTAANGAGFVFDLPRGINISNGIKIAATTTATGATTVSTGLIGFVVYR